MFSVLTKAEDIRNTSTLLVGGEAAETARGYRSSIFGTSGSRFFIVVAVRNNNGLFPVERVIPKTQLAFLLSALDQPSNHPIFQSWTINDCPRTGYELEF
jgi:hypothetical protein